MASQTFGGLDKVGAFPCLAHVVRVFKIQAPSAFFNTCRRNDAALAHYGLVLYRTEIALLQRLALAPRLAAVLRAHHPAGPVGHLVANLEVDNKVASGYLFRSSIFSVRMLI